jgi:glutamine synthetase
MMGYIWNSSNTKAKTTIIEYIWIDDTDIRLRSKSRTLNCGEITGLEQIPEWSYDGSSTGQSEVSNSEIILKPVFYCKDPFRGSNNIMALCSTFKWDKCKPTKIHSDVNM